MLDQLAQWDRDLFVFLNSLGIEDYDFFWIYITQIEHWIPLYLLFFILFFVWLPWKRALIYVVATFAVFGITYAFTNFVKITVERLRPNNSEELTALIRILQTPGDFSFFSGHASVSMAVTTFVVLCLRDKSRWVYLCYIWPLLFVLSRIYVGVHYPSDILIGAAVGTGIAVVCKFLLDRFVSASRALPVSI